MKSPVSIPILTVIALAAGAAAVSAQGTPAPRYFIKPRLGVAVPHRDLVISVQAIAVVDPGNPDARSGVLTDLDYPQFGISAVAAKLTDDQLARLNTNLYTALPDVPLVPTSGPAGPAWALNQFSMPPAAIGDPCPQATPTVYIVDTGIVSSHPDFAYPPANQVLSFQTGLSYGYNVSVNPAVLLPPYTDAFDHGTRIAGCLGGVTSGLLGALGGRANVKSVVIYDAPIPGPLTTFVSQAIDGILGSTADHQARKAQPYLKNHASVLIFAHSTTQAAGRFADLDRAIEIAWEEGLHVIMSAGNEGIPAVDVSPAGAAWGYTLGGPPVRFFYGPPPIGATFYRAADEFLIAGAYQQNPDFSLQIWPGSNLPIPGAAVVDGYAPGALVPCPALTPPGSFLTGTGTSYSAALTGALATWATTQRPWAAPVDLRRWVRTSRLPIPGGLRFETPTLPNEPMTYHAWIHHYYPIPVLPAGVDLPLADPDGDGMENFVEYYCGLDPRMDEAALRPALTATTSPGTTVLLAHLHKACWLGPAPQVALRMERSTDLLTWTPLPLTDFSPTGAASPADGVPWKATAAATPLVAKEFFRLRFTATGPL